MLSDILYIVTLCTLCKGVLSSNMIKYAQTFFPVAQCCDLTVNVPLMHFCSQESPRNNCPTCKWHSLHVWYLPNIKPSKVSPPTLYIKTNSHVSHKRESIVLLCYYFESKAILFIWSEKQFLLLRILCLSCAWLICLLHCLGAHLHNLVIDANHLIVLAYYLSKWF